VTRSRRSLGLSASPVISSFGTSSHLRRIWIRIVDGIAPANSDLDSTDSVPIALAGMVVGMVVGVGVVKEEEEENEGPKGQFARVLD